jgi:hypothetical protein
LEVAGQDGGRESVRLGERGLHFHLGEEVKFDDEGSNGLESDFTAGRFDRDSLRHVTMVFPIKR